MQTFNPLVSVIIPTSNWPDLPVRSVKSELLQTYQTSEIVVIDGPDDCPLQPSLRSGALGSDPLPASARNASDTPILKNMPVAIIVP